MADSSWEYGFLNWSYCFCKYITVYAIFSDIAEYVVLLVMQLHADYTGDQINFKIMSRIFIMKWENYFLSV